MPTRQFVGSIGEGTSTATARLFAALNETVSFQFSIDVAGKPVEDPRFEIDELKTDDDSIDAAAIQLFRLHAVKNDDYPGWHIRNIHPDARNPEPLDVLVPCNAPRGGWPQALVPGERYHFWVDIAVGKAGSPGLYRTSLTFFDDVRRLDVLKIEIEVWPFSLSDRNLIPLIADVDHRQLFAHHLGGPARSSGFASDDWRQNTEHDALDELLSRTLRRLRQHRLSPVLPRLAPMTKVGTRLHPEVDWDQYDRIVSPLLDGSLFINKIPLSAWPLPTPLELFGSDSRPSFGRNAMHNDFAKAFLSECASHFEQKGWLSRSYYELPVSLSSVGSTSDISHSGLLIRSADASIPILLPWFPQDLQPYGWVEYDFPPSESYVDIWMPPAQFYDAEVMVHERLAGRKTWLAADRPPFSGSAALHAPETTTRILAQQAARLGADAIHLGPVNHWPPPDQKDSPEDCLRFDNHILLYPGRPFGLNEPVASVRLKHLRRSMQDQAYHALLERHGLEHVSNAVRTALAPYAGTAAYHTHYADGRATGWPSDTTLFEVGRLIMTREFMDHVYPHKYEHLRSLFNKDALWRRLMVETRRFQTEVQGTRVRLGSPGDAIPVETEIVLDLFNNRRAPVSGCVRAKNLPRGWSEADTSTCFSEIHAGSTKPVRLKIGMESVPLGLDGHVVVPLEIETVESENIATDALVSCVTAYRFERPITIDGDLADWPAGRSNVAGDFRLITAGTDRNGLEGRLPTSGTLVFVGRDDNSLLIGITCESTGVTPALTARRKSVIYEDMIPMGEELIEVLIDPHNAGSRSPEDLFHIVVKRSGIDVTEAGVGFQPPCGHSEHWPVELEIVTTVAPSRWNVEMRIPLSAFGQVGMTPTIWGFNMTRFDLANKEFSTWSGAVRNAYDPASLGNLYLP